MNLALERNGKLQTFGKLADFSFNISVRGKDVVKNEPTFCAIFAVSDWKTARLVGQPIGKPA